MLSNQSLFSLCSLSQLVCFQYQKSLDDRRLGFVITGGKGPPYFQIFAIFNA